MPEEKKPRATHRRGAAQRRHEMERIRKEAQFYGERVSEELNPYEVLMYGLQISVSIVRYLERKIGEWDTDEGADGEEDQGGGPVNHKTGMPSLTEDLPGAGGGLTRVTRDQELWLRTYREERKIMQQTAKMCIELGISERQMQLAEAQADMMFSIIEKTVEALGLSAAQQNQLPLILPQIIRGAIEPGGSSG